MGEGGKRKKKNKNPPNPRTETNPKQVKYNPYGFGFPVHAQIL